MDSLRERLMTPIQRRSIKAMGLVTKQHAEAVAHEYERLVTYLVQKECELLTQLEMRTLRDRLSEQAQKQERQEIRQTVQQSLDLLMGEIQEKITFDTVAEAVDAEHLQSRVR